MLSGSHNLFERAAVSGQGEEGVSEVGISMMSKEGLLCNCSACVLGMMRKKVLVRATQTCDLLVEM